MSNCNSIRTQSIINKLARIQEPWRMNSIELYMKSAMFANDNLPTWAQIPFAKIVECALEIMGPALTDEVMDAWNSTREAFLGIRYPVRFLKSAARGLGGPISWLGQSVARFAAFAWRAVRLTVVNFFRISH